MSRCYQLVESCCELIGLHLGMREVLHLFGLSCACLGACRSSIVSPRVICFWISFLAAIKFLQIVVSDLVCIWVCVACWICVACVVLALWLVAVPTCALLACFLGISCVVNIDVLRALVSGLVCIWVCVTCCICVVCVGLAHGLVAAPAFFSMRPFLWISCLADIKVYGWSALGYAWHVALLWLALYLFCLSSSRLQFFVLCYQFLSLFSICFRLR